MILNSGLIFSQALKSQQGPRHSAHKEALRHLRQVFPKPFGGWAGRPGLAQALGASVLPHKPPGAILARAGVVSTVMLCSAWPMSICHLGTKYSPYTEPSAWNPERRLNWLGTVTERLC